MNEAGAEDDGARQANGVRLQALEGTVERAAAMDGVEELAPAEVGWPPGEGPEAPL